MRSRYIALGITILLVFSVFSAVALATGRGSQFRSKQVNFSFANEWGTYWATAYYVEGMENAPVVLFLHGLDANKDWYKWMIDPYVRAGYVFVMFNVPGKWAVQGLLSTEPEFGPYVDGFSTCIDSLSSQQELRGVVDLDLIAATGHSAGGLGAMVAATKDTRIKAVVALAPPIHNPKRPHPTEFNIPIQLQAGSNEGDLREGVVSYYNQELDAPVKQLIVIHGGNHIQFMDVGIVRFMNLLAQFGFEIPHVGNQPSEITTQEQHRISSGAFLSFLNANLHA